MQRNCSATTRAAAHHYFFTKRLNPPITGQLLVTVHLDGTIAPGAVTFLIERERSGGLTPGGTLRERTMGLGYLKRRPGAIEARGVRLPPHATLVRYSPESTATVFAEPPATVVWNSADLGTNAAVLSVTFAVR